jgi:signal transduction histidine kinase
MPVPMELAIGELQKQMPDARIVRLTGQLLDQHLAGENQVLELRSGRSVFRAVFGNNHKLKPIPIGSVVETTGVCWIERSSGKPAADILEEPLVAAFQVLLRTPTDVVVRQRPPWWTWKHTVATICGLLFILAAALVWIRSLHRQVAQRTQDLKMTMGRLERETEISATLAERNRMAGEIHDGLEQGLSAIMMQLDGLESKLEENPTEAARHLKLARNMVRFSRTEVRHSLWEWRSPALANKDLGSALAEIGAQMSGGNHAKVTVEVAGSPFPLPADVEHHLLRIGQEALNNALKYARAKTIQVQLDYLDRSVCLRVRDDGRGFDPETVLNGSAGHLGLQNLRSRARKMRGQLTVVSALDQGTKIEVTVPVKGKNSGSETNEPHST